MTADEMLAVYVRLTADLYQQLEEEQADHAATRADVTALHARIAELAQRPARKKAAR